MVPVGGEPFRMEIEGHCRAWQRAIGDRYFTSVAVGPRISIVCDEDYHGIEDQPNGCGLYGPYFFVKMGSDGDPRSLTKPELEKCRRYWQARRYDAPPEPGGSHRVLTAGTEEFEEFLRVCRIEAEAKRTFWESI